MKTTITFITTFPELYPGPLGVSIFKRAMELGIFDIKTVNIKDNIPKNNGRMDDYPFGGGPGLVLRADVAHQAIKSALLLNNDHDIISRESIAVHEKPIIIVPSAKGVKFNTQIAKTLSKYKKIYFLNSRFEGVDQRLIDYYHAVEISIGDYIIAGGDVASMVVSEGILRFVDGVLGNPETLEEESFSINDPTNKSELLVESNHYTRPAVWMDMKVPEVLIGGNHAKVKAWKMQQSIINTKKRSSNDSTFLL
jgi:tRNA (guanine37-N1)-methyltransferase